MTLNELVKECHNNALNKGFWDCFNTTKSHFVVAIKVSLIHSELSEALEAVRTDQEKYLEEEIADTLIRIFDLVGYLGFDLDQAVLRKMNINASRPYLHNKFF